MTIDQQPRQRQPTKRNDNQQIFSAQNAEFENDLTFSWLTTIFTVQKCLSFGKKHFFKINFLKIWYWPMAIFLKVKL